MKKLLLQTTFGACMGLATAPSAVSAQAAAPQPGPVTAPARVYTNVEQMPQLPSGGGTKAVVAAIERLVVQASPGIARSARGRVVVSFKVGADGVLKDGFIDTGLGPGPDEAVLAALNKLPRFLPGRQQGQRVAVQLRLPITFPVVAAEPPASK